jgi:dCMP deaminase
MQKAVDIVNTSMHEKNKIAATIFGQDSRKNNFSISYTNYWPESILSQLGTSCRIGNASGTIHAETACIIHAPYTGNASICITDPFCPNCAKNMAEAGIKKIYIDHKGFNKDFVDRRAYAFENMSMRICEKAGINVYQLWRKEERIEPIFEIDPEFTPAMERPVEIISLASGDKDELLALINEKTAQYNGQRLAIAVCHDEEDNKKAICVRPHLVTGYTSHEAYQEIESHKGKYSFIQEPVNRLITNAPRLGLRPVNGLSYYSQVPTSREFVNMIGAGINQFFIGNRDLARDEDAFEAMALLEKEKIIKIEALQMS